MANGNTLKAAQERQRQDIIREARAAGVSESEIDPKYIEARQKGSAATERYTQSAIKKGKSSKREKASIGSAFGTTSSNIDDIIAQGAEARRKALLAGIKGRERAQIEALEGQRAGITQGARTARGQTDIEALQAGQRLTGQLAEQGLNRSGQFVTGQLGIQTARQQQLGQISQLEQDQLNNLNTQISQVRLQAETARQQGLQNIEAELQLQRLQEAQQGMLRDIQVRQGQQALQRGQLELGFLPQQQQQALQRGQLELGYLPQQYEQQFQQGQQALALGQAQLDYLPQQQELERRRAEYELNRPYFAPQRAPQVDPTTERLRQLQLQQAEIEFNQFRQQNDPAYQAQVFANTNNQIQQTISALQREGESQGVIEQEIFNTIRNLNLSGGISDAIAESLLTQYGLRL